MQTKEPCKRCGKTDTILIGQNTRTEKLNIPVGAYQRVMQRLVKCQDCGARVWTRAELGRMRVHELLYQ